MVLLAAGAAAIARHYGLLTRIEDSTRGGSERVALARKASGPRIAARVKHAGLTYPPGEIFVRAFKHEAELEIWGREASEPFRHVATFPILSRSGGPGPKRREGDRQVPEGCYIIDRFNPESSYHLSLGLNYPNASDRILSDRERPGFDIFIHGGRLSVGCLAIGDDAIEELYLLAIDAHLAGQGEIPVHIFPARMSGASWKSLHDESAAEARELAAFWSHLRRIYESFERTRIVPPFEIAPDGSYRVSGET